MQDLDAKYESRNGHGMDDDCRDDALAHLIQCTLSSLCGFHDDARILAAIISCDSSAHRVVGGFVEGMARSLDNTRCSQPPSA